MIVSGLLPGGVLGCLRKAQQQCAVGSVGQGCKRFYFFEFFRPIAIFAGWIERAVSVARFAPNVREFDNQDLASKLANALPTHRWQVSRCTHKQNASDMVLGDIPVANAQCFVKNLPETRGAALAHLPMLARQDRRQNGAAVTRVARPAAPRQLARDML